MSVQAYYSSQNYGARSSAYNAPYAPYTRGVYTIGLNPRQASNPNPKVIPAPIPSNLVPYRKEESLKKLTEEDDDPVDVNNPQYQEFLARRDKQAQIPSPLPPSNSAGSTVEEPWYLKKPSVRVGDPIAINTNRGWVRAKVAAIKNGRVGVAETLTGWRYYRRNGPTTILYYDFDSPFWKYDGKRLVNDPKDINRRAEENRRREEARNRYSYSPYYNHTPPADSPAPEEQPVKFKVRRTEPVYYQNPETGRYVYNRQGPAYEPHCSSKVHHKEKIVFAPEKHESHKRHSFFKDRNKQAENENDASTDSLEKSGADAKLERDRKRGEMIEQRIFCHLDKKQLAEYTQGKLKLNDLPALRPLLFDIEVDLDTQNIVYPGEEEYETNDIIVDGPIDEQHLVELNKDFFEQFGSADSDNGIVYADDGHSNEYDDELSRFDIRGSQNSYDMNMPSLSSSSSTELDPDALHIRPVNDDFALDSYYIRSTYYEDRSSFHVQKHNDELTLEAFNVVLGEPENDTRQKLDQVQTIKPEAYSYEAEPSKKHIEEEEVKPIVETHEIAKSMDLKLDYFVDILDTRTGQIRCEMGPKLVEICHYEDIVKGPERLY